jgi:ethanolamine kinase
MRSIDLVNVTLDDSNKTEFEATLYDLCFRVNKTWTSLPKSDITIRNMNGGLTNTLYAVYLTKDGLNTSNTLLFRIYGPNTDSFLSRSDEIHNMITMKSIDLGPDVYFKFNNGICYEYLTGDITTTQTVIDPTIYPIIAETVGRMHGHNWHKYRNERCCIFNTAKQILNIINADYKSTMHHMTDHLLKTTPTKLNLIDELEFLENYFNNYCEKGAMSRIVNSHNDLLLANIIYSENDKVIRFIDYEYGGPNFQAFDIANHFNEFPGVDIPVDYANKFPNKEFQCLWLKSYWKGFYLEIGKNEDDFKRDITDEFIDNFCIEVNKFTLVSHLLWIIWSLVQAQGSHDSFNFVEYANCRFVRYQKMKLELLR